MHAILYLLSGFLTILSPAFFLMLVVTMILFTEIVVAENDKKAFPVMFCLFIVLLYSLFGLAIAQNQMENTIGIMYYLSLVLALIVGTFILGGFRLLFPKKLPGYSVRLGLLLCMGFLLFKVSIPSTAPVLGAVLMKGVSGSIGLDVVLSMVLFAIGLIIPAYLWLLFWVKHQERFTMKSWWKHVERISGGCLILYTIVDFCFKI